MEKFTIAFTAVMTIAILLTWISVAYAEDLTIDNVSITEQNGGIKYTPTGSAPSYVCLDVSIRNPNGDLVDITYDTACTNVDPYYQFEGYIVNPFNADGWTIQICDPSNGLVGVCVDSDFNISFSSLTNSPPSEEEEVDIPSETIPEEDFVEVSATDGVEYDGQTGEPLAETETIEVVSTQSPADNETLNLRLEILKVLENILAILFGR